MGKNKISNIKYKILFAVALLVFSASCFAGSNTVPVDINKLAAQKMKAVENWQDLRFGLFIHWGPVSIKGTEIGWSRGNEVPKAEYDQLYKQFNPEKFNASAWVKFAKDTGVKYIVITSKHHDGFCIFDSAFTDYDIMSSPFKRDILAELSTECKKQGMNFGVYYSICDWHHPDYPTDSPGGREAKKKSDIKRYFTYAKNQLKEIIAKYSPVSVLWFDGHWEDCWPNEYGEQIYKNVNELSPGIVINNRLSRAGQSAEGASFVGDYETPEQEIGQFDLKRPWESCITIGTQWAWKPNDKIKSFKECIETLVRTAGNNGNLLLNVGPMPDGSIEPRQADRFYEIGNWLKTCGESIYETRGGPFMPGNWGASTHKDNKIYLHILDWKGSDTLLLPDVGKKVTTSRLLGGGDVEVKYVLYTGDTSDIKQEKGYLQIKVEKADQKQPDTVVVLELDGNASDIKPIDTSAKIEIEESQQDNPDKSISANQQRETKEQKEKRLQWWRDARFGVFIHWGPVSIKGTELTWSRGGDRRGGSEGGLGSSIMPAEEYDNLYKQFNPVKFDADFWAQIASGAGMKYIVFVAKHWDGFCEWPTETTEYSIKSTPFKRDICGELAKAARKNGLRIGWYFCPADLHDPDCNTETHEKYIARMREQLKELLTSYGQIAVMWFDYAGHNSAPWDQPNTYKLVRSLQPDIIINNRLDMASMNDYWAQKVLPGADYYTPEQFVGGFNNKIPWETCMTLGTQWSWKPNDNLKSLKECIDILVKCVGGDGNLLLNVGPMPDGRIEPRQVERLLEIGKWLEKNGQTIYGTRGGPFKPGNWGASTYKGNNIYVHILNWQGKDTLTLPDIGKKILKSSLLGGGSVTIEKTEEGINVAVPKQNQDSLDTIVVLQIDSDAASIEPVDVKFRSGSLAAGKKAIASNVFENQSGHNADKAFDDDFGTRWATDFGVKECSLEVDLGDNKKFSRVLIDEAYAGRVKSFALQYKDGEQWKDFFKGAGIGRNFTSGFEPVSSRFVRLYVTDANEGPTINEFQIFAGKGKE